MTFLDDVMKDKLSKEQIEKINKEEYFREVYDKLRIVGYEIEFIFNYLSTNTKEEVESTLNDLINKARKTLDAIDRYNRDENGFLI